MEDLATLASLYDSHSDTYGGTPFLPVEVNMRCEGVVLTAATLCSCVRNIKLPQLRREAILALRSCSLYIDDEDRLQRALPYVVALLSDPTAVVRCAAMETLCDILSDETEAVIVSALDCLSISCGRELSSKRESVFFLMQAKQKQ